MQLGKGGRRRRSNGPRASPGTTLVAYIAVEQIISYLPPTNLFPGSSGSPFRLPTYIIFSRTHGLSILQPETKLVRGTWVIPAIEYLRYPLQERYWWWWWWWVWLVISVGPFFYYLYCCQSVPQFVSQALIWFTCCPLLFSIRTPAYSSIGRTSRSSPITLRADVNDCALHKRFAAQTLTAYDLQRTDACVVKHS